jgi:hypothetical protein
LEGTVPTWLTVVIVIVVVVVLAGLVVSMTSKKRAEQNRARAEELRTTASDRGGSLTETQRQADEAKAKAELARAEAQRAEEQAAAASQGHQVEQARYEDQLREADQIDPDVNTKAKDYEPNIWNDASETGDTGTGSDTRTTDTGTTDTGTTDTGTTDTGTGVRTGSGPTDHPGIGGITINGQPCSPGRDANCNPIVVTARSNARGALGSDLDLLHRLTARERGADPLMSSGLAEAASRLATDLFGGFATLERRGVRLVMDMEVPQDRRDSAWDDFKRPQALATSLDRIARRRATVPREARYEETTAIESE